MYNRMPPVSLSYPASQPPIREKPLDLRQILRFFTSNGLLVALVTMLFAAATLVYVLLTPPTFVSSAQLMLQTQNTSVSDVQRQAEEAFVEGQMEIMKSGDVLQAVVRRMNLTVDPEFQASRLPVGEMLRSLLSSTPDGGKTERNALSNPEDQLENYTIATLRSRLWIRRVGQSTVIELSAASSDPKKAAKIANAIAEQYIAQNLSMKSWSALQSSQWLEKRVADIKELVLAADRAVMDFQSLGDTASQFKLTELKSVAETNRRLYETYLQNWTEAKQRISYSVPDAVFVSRAAAPVTKSQPKSLLLLIFATVLGLCTGIVVSIVRHFSNRAVTRADRVASEVYVPCIGEIAQVKRPRLAKGSTPPKLLGFNRSYQSMHSLKFFNRDVESLRATVAALRRMRKAKLIGLVGTEPKAGATTVAFNLAVLSSLAGSRTLLIDACSTDPTLSEIFGDETPGLMEILNDHGACSEFLSRADKPLTVLTIGTYGEVTPGARLGSERVAVSLADLKEHFDLILVDLPSIAESADAKSIAPHLDGAVVVARYGKSSFDTLLEVVDTLRDVGADVFGVVLNAVPKSTI